MKKYYLYLLDLVFILKEISNIHVWILRKPKWIRHLKREWYDNKENIYFIILVKIGFS